MTAVTIERRPATPARARPGTGVAHPAFGSGRRGGPAAHPYRGAPAYAAPARSGVRACRPPADPAVPAAASWRLTDRGVAVVLVVGVMIMVAALTVVGLTALRVTGPDYRPDVSAVLLNQ